MNGGTCTESGVCDCTPQWQGPTCEQGTASPDLPYPHTCTDGWIAHCYSINALYENWSDFT